MKRERFKLKDYPFGGVYALEWEGLSYLWVRSDSGDYLWLDQCGHFGLSFQQEGLLKVQGLEIWCPGHGISFDLTSGQIINRPYENCDSLVAVSFEIKEGAVWV